MTLLLDTHTFLWFVNDDPDLSSEARRRIEMSDVDVLLSVASIWEMSIKFALGKFSEIPSPIEQFIPQQLTANNIRVLPIGVPHALRVASLPHHHGDPFDRILVAQALTENIPLVSRDKILSSYGVTRIW